MAGQFSPPPAAAGWGGTGGNGAGPPPPTAAGAGSSAMTPSSLLEVAPVTGSSNRDWALTPALTMLSSSALALFSGLALPMTPSSLLEVSLALILPMTVSDSGGASSLPLFSPPPAAAGWGGTGGTGSGAWVTAELKSWGVAWWGTATSDEDVILWSRAGDTNRSWEKSRLCYSWGRVSSRRAWGVPQTRLRITVLRKLLMRAEIARETTRESEPKKLKWPGAGSCLGSAGANGGWSLLLVDIWTSDENGTRDFVHISYKKQQQSHLRVPIGGRGAIRSLLFRNVGLRLRRIQRSWLDNGWI